jgi:hypothetical protein
VNARVAAALVALLLAACRAPAREAADPVAELGPAVVRQYADIARAAYEDAAAGARRVRAAVDALVAGTERLYRGPGADGGLAALARAAAPAIDGRARAAFAAATAALAALAEVPLAAATGERRSEVERAYRATKDLERTLKVDLASALGVTLTFTGSDGD